MGSVRTGQIVRLETETDMREQPGERAILAAEFRKAAFQLGELRRRDTYLLRRVALLEHERRYVQASFETQVTESARLNAELADARHHLEAALEAQSAESARLNAELADIRHRITELERALEAQARQSESKRHQGDARRRRTEDLHAALDRARPKLLVSTLS
jgi:chromosome segregation ATPase